MEKEKYYLQNALSSYNSLLLRNCNIFDRVTTSVALQIKTWIFYTHESGFWFIDSSYRLIMFCVIMCLVCISDVTGRQSYHSVCLTLLSCIACCLHFTTSSLPVPSFVFQLKFISFVAYSLYMTFYILKQNALFLQNMVSYSHFLYINLLTMILLKDLACVLLQFLYVNDTIITMIINMITCMFLTIILTVIPGMVAYEEALDHKDKIIANKASHERYISHELRGPLNVTSMAIEYCMNVIPEDTTDPEKQSILESLMEANCACDDGLTILNGLLLNDKVDNSIVILNKEELKVKSFVTDYLKMYVAQVHAKSIKLEMYNCDVDSELFLTQLSTDSLTQLSTGDTLSLRKSQNSLDFRTVSSKSMKTKIDDNTFGLSETFTSGECIEDDDTLFADKSKLGQVIRNLMSNAIKFTPDEGTIKVFIKFIPKYSQPNEVLATNGMLIFEVKDSGAGISLENIPRLFNEVVQFNPEKLQGGGGSGFGLVLCKSIVDMHDGSLSAHSEGEGFGSTFRLQVPMMHYPKMQSNDSQMGTQGLSINNPIATDEFATTSISSNTVCQDDTSNSTPLVFRHRLDVNIRNTIPATITIMPSSKRLFSYSIEETTRPPDDSQSTCTMSNRPITPFNAVIPVFNKKRLLLVDDAATNRKILRKLLEQSGHECEEAKNGVEGLQMMKDVFRRPTHWHCDSDSAIGPNKTSNDYYDAILMDFVMPEMSGPDATRAIRELGYAGPIIGVTGNARDEDRNVFLNAGATDVIIKPLKKAHLLKFINM